MKIKKKADEKTNIIDGKTWYLFYSAAIGSFVGAAGIAKAINDNKATSIGRTENASWKVIYLVPYKRG